MKYIIQQRGHGKYRHGVPKKISRKKAENLESQDKKVYDSYEEAKEHC